MASPLRHIPHVATTVVSGMDYERVCGRRAAARAVLAP